MILWFGQGMNQMKIMNKIFNTPLNGKEKSLFQAIEEGKDSAIDFYNDWITEVKATIPPERLLIFNVNEGWNPLCEFLEKPIPNEPFPKENDAKLTTSMVRKSKFMTSTWYIFIGLIAPLLLALIFYFFHDDFFEAFNDFLTFLKPYCNQFCQYVQKSYEDILNLVQPYIDQFMALLQPYFQEFCEIMKPYLEAFLAFIHPYIEDFQKAIKF